MSACQGLFRKFRTTTAVALVLTGALTLAACGNGAKTADEYVESAQQMRLAGNLQGAVLNLKSALQQSPDSAPARFALGEVYLEIGDGASAEKEFQRAQEAGMNEAALKLPLARSWLLQKEYDRVLSDLPLPAEGGTDREFILTLHGQAFLGKGDLDAAEEMFDQAVALNAQSVGGLVGQARVAMSRSDFDTAKAREAAVEKLDPDAIETLSLKGDLAYATKDFATAEATFKTLSDKRPQSLLYRLGLAWAQNGSGKADDALKTLQPVLKALPNNPQANYLMGLVHYDKKDYQDARNAMGVVLAASSDNPAALLISGASSYSLKEYEQALGFLNRFVALSPKYEPGLKLLAMTQMQLGQPDRARATLEPIANSKDLKDGEILQVVGAAAAASGDLQSGKNYLERAVVLDPGDASLRAKLGMMRIGLGEDEAGVTDLSAAAKANPDLNVDLAAGFIRAGQYDKALDTAHQIQREQPKSAVGYVIEGMAQDRLKHEDEAKAAYKKALEIDPAAGDAAHNLAVISERHNQFKDARQIYADFLKKNPDNVPILMQLAQLDARLGDATELGTTLNHIVKLVPEDPAPRILLGRFYLSQNNYAKAEEVTQEVLQNASSNPALLQVLGLAQIYQNKPEARDTFTRLTNLEPSANNFYWLSRADTLAGDSAGAWNAIGRSRQMDAGNAEFALYQGGLAWRRRDGNTLEKVLADLKDKKSYDYRLLTAYKAILDKKDADAEGLLKALDAEKPNSEVLVQLAAAQTRQGKSDVATATMVDWLKAHPDDGIVRLQLGQLYIALNQFDKASAELTTLVKASPDSWPAQNNLSWALLQQGKEDAALEHAEKARTLAPNNPAVLDTYGRVMLQKGQVQKAVSSLEQAAKDMPQATDTQVVLAKAYAGAGRNDDAVEVLQKLLAGNKDFPEKVEAQSLLSEYQAKGR